MNLAGARVLVTGCSSGIGRALVPTFADAGADVIATARRRDSLAGLERPGVRLAELDVTDPGACTTALVAAEPLDVLVNNAGYGLLGAVEECGDEELRAQYEANLLGPWRLIRLALPGMRGRGRGAIVNVSSVGAHVPFPGLAAYRSSKAALELLTWTLHLEVARFGIRVLSVQPGLTETDFSVRSARDASGVGPDSPYEPMRESAERVYPRISPRALRPEVVAAAIVAELSRDTGPLRLRVGDDAKLMIERGAEGAEAYERFLVEECGLDWHRPSET